MSILPAKRPEWPRAEVERVCGAAGLDPFRQVILVGRRGYFRRTMGDPAANDIGIFDDALFLVGPGVFRSFNANTDPSRGRPGMATLTPGVWRYRVGIHGLSRPEPLRYEALVQAAPVTVHRQGQGDDTGWFGINIHRGGQATTGSEGCQTLPPGQWPEFMALVKQHIAKNPRREIPYLLTENLG